jgi:hypothetical protein
MNNTVAPQLCRYSALTSTNAVNCPWKQALSLDVKILGRRSDRIMGRLPAADRASTHRMTELKPCRSDFAAFHPSMLHDWRRYNFHRCTHLACADPCILRKGKGGSEKTPHQSAITPRDAAGGTKYHWYTGCSWGHKVPRAATQPGEARSAKRGGRQLGPEDPPSPDINLPLQ